MSSYEIYIKAGGGRAGGFICSREGARVCEEMGGDTEHFPSRLHDAIFNESIKKTKT